MQYLRTLWTAFLKNLDVYAIIGIALALSVLGIIGTASIPVVLSGTLATLALLAFSILRNRQTDETIERKLEHLAKPQQAMSSLDFLSEWESSYFNQRLETARTLSSVGMTDPRFIVENFTQFRNLAQRGGKIRLIVPIPRGHAIRMIAERSFNVTRGVTDRSSSALSLLNTIQKLLEAVPKGSVEVQLTDHLHSAVVTMLDDQFPNGAIFVTLYGFGQFYGSRPSFVLHKERDGKWFDFYQSTFENLWNWEGAEPFDPAKHLPPTNPQPPTPHPHRAPLDPRPANMI